MNENCVLKIDHLSFGYNKNELLYDNFNLSLNKNEIVSIVGSSGSGKSTLFELITHNLTPISGTIKVKKVAFIFQDPYSSFHPSYAIIDQINDVVESYSEIKLVELLDKLDLKKSLVLQKPHKLSGGQLQRCSILRAILMKPDILLADEPTSALDNIVALETMKLLVGFIDKFGILLITHDSNLASWCSNRVINIEI